MNTKIQTIVNDILAVLIVIFGLNKFLAFIPVEPPADPTAQQFMGAMFSMYLFKVVALAEMIGGILLIIPTTRFIGWLLLLPAIFNIVAFYLAHDFVGNGIWLLPTLLFLAIGFTHKAHLITLIAVKS